MMKSLVIHTPNSDFWHACFLRFVILKLATLQLFVSWLWGSANLQPAFLQPEDGGKGSAECGTLLGKTKKKGKVVHDDISSQQSPRSTCLHHAVLRDVSKFVPGARGS